MVRPAGSLEVYKQKQNILFIFESVEHRRFKVTWARLWVCLGVCTAECSCRAYARPSARVERMHGRVLGCVHGRVRVSSVCTAECSGVCTAECACRARGTAVRDDGLDGCAARRFVRPRLGYSFCTTRMGARLGLVVVHDLVGTRPRFGRDARIGCTRAKLYGHDRAMWLVF